MLRDALKDRIRCRAVETVQNDTVLTATGDSVTSAHHQFGFGLATCANTSFDHRNLPGNNGVFSYAQRYFDANGSIVDYENFARTGFDTGLMLAAGPGNTDACTNFWARGSSPVGLAAARIAKAKADKHKAYHVTTGGANNTNWATILKQLAKCRAMEYAAINLNPGGVLRMIWGSEEGKAGIITKGGGCALWFDNPLPAGEDYYYNVDIPPYNGAAALPRISADVNTIVNTLLAAGADKLVWMLYYDITPAQVDVGNFGWTLLRSVAPEWAKGYIPPTTTPWMWTLLDPLWVPAVKALQSDINFAIWWGMPSDQRAMVAFPPTFTAADMQVTAGGGSPHPSPAGHAKLAATLAAVFNQIP